MSDKKISAVVVSDFRDAGTEEAFTAGATVQISEGAFVNYEAAGLVRKPDADDKAAPAKGEPKAA